MTEQTRTPSTNQDDKRWSMVETTMRRHGFQSRALIETLHSVQEAYGYIDIEPMKNVAKALQVPLSRVYGVATFYHYFTLKPQGEHTCVVCTGTACYIKGAQKILDAMEKEFNVKPGGTTADRKLSLLTARCFGSCGLAPAAVVDGSVQGKMKAEELIEEVRTKLRDA